MFESEISLANATSFIIQLSVVLIFSTTLFGFAIKKLLQVIRG